MFKTLDTMADIRAQRLNIVTIRLPALYWWVVMLAVAMLLFVSSSIEQTPFRRTILCAQAAVVGGFLGFVFIMDQPFRGETAISADAIVRSIERIDARTQ
jgi:FtsH-binding integral membrane protein